MRYVQIVILGLLACLQVGCIVRYVDTEIRVTGAGSQTVEGNLSVGGFPQRETRKLPFVLKERAAYDNKILVDVESPNAGVITVEIFIDGKLKDRKTSSNGSVQASARTPTMSSMTPLIFWLAMTFCVLLLSMAFLSFRRKNRET